ncbi:hypothetical protein EFS28_09780 [Lactobacillus acidophilus]|uniref:hypothetical protein n=1 Tax=Lactobacillus acidophilus TaxID=1579 RepID=UPI0021A6A96B|nr:hypothetical protein [Lactobacillus acidophilus]MCT3602241.1 hypothetical protein [Lactobacillus acidophilus]MCT3624480.1 hypothetical protein [Lactobacillus acidophilus]
MKDSKDVIMDLKVEVKDYDARVLKIENKIFNPNGLSKRQVELLKIQRKIFKELIDVVDLRIEDLEANLKRED